MDRYRVINELQRAIDDLTLLKVRLEVDHALQPDDVIERWLQEDARPAASDMMNTFMATDLYDRSES